MVYPWKSLISHVQDFPVLICTNQGSLRKIQTNEADSLILNY